LYYFHVYHFTELDIELSKQTTVIPISYCVVLKRYNYFLKLKANKIFHHVLVDSV